MLVIFLINTLISCFARVEINVTAQSKLLTVGGDNHGDWMEMIETARF